LKLEGFSPRELWGTILLVLSVPGYLAARVPASLALQD
jgi:hypothetical protein